MFLELPFDEPLESKLILPVTVAPGYCGAAAGKAIFDAPEVAVIVPSAVLIVAFLPSLSAENVAFLPSPSVNVVSFLEPHLSTRQYARLVDEWVGAVGLNVHEYGTHSLRRTKASLIYKATGNLRAIQILLGHSNIENTVRYLGVDVDDAITLAERAEI
jgi:hypothetical protein